MQSPAPGEEPPHAGRQSAGKQLRRKWPRGSGEHQVECEQAMHPCGTEV